MQNEKWECFVSHFLENGDGDGGGSDGGGGVGSGRHKIKSNTGNS